jgi:nicotinamide-nucleotide amidase
MSAEVGILVVGNEILDGVVLDTNSQWLINRLKPLNFMVHEAITVRDSLPEIGRGLVRLMADGCTIVFTTGGLGPTHDDMTVQGVAGALGLPLKLNQEALAVVTRQYRALHERGIIESGKLTDSRRKMAVLPKGAKPLDNRVGGAPGVLVEAEGSTIICLPGVPLEMKWIFDDQVMPLLRARVRGAYAEEIVSLPLRDESTLSPIIDQVMKESPGIYVKSMVRPYGEEGIRLWVSSKGEDKEEVEKRVRLAVERLQRLTHEILPNG